MAAAPDAVRRSARRPGARRILLVVLGCLLGLVAAEGLVRALGVRPYPSWSPRYLHVADPELGLVPAPSFDGRQESEEYSVAIRTNALGLRSSELPAEPGFVVCVLGDSFAFGHGVEQEEAAPELLQRILEDAREPGSGPLTVLNLGVMSYGPRQSVNRFERISGRIEPDLCLLLFYAGNDVLDEVRPPLAVRSGYVVGADEPVPLWRRLQLWLKYRSAVYRVIADARPPAEIAGRCSGHPSFGFDLFRRVPTEEVARGWISTRETLRELRRSADGLGCRLAVAVIPTRYQVDPALWRRECETCGFAEEDFDLERVQTELRAACDELRVPCLDLLPAFRRADRPLYFSGLLEMHLDAEGHRLMAEALAEFLSAEGLL